MNWKNVFCLLRIERKSGRLIRGIKATRYRENGFIAYWPYWTAAIIGVIGGFIANLAISAIYSEAKGLQPLNVEALGFFAVLPTLVLVASLIFTLLQQIQLSGIKASTQVMYWLPVTWQEHTVASILANLLGWPIAIVTGLTTGVVVFSVFHGLILQALLTVIVMCAAAFMASSITESLRILQVRFTGAVYKSSGRAAIWVRFVGSILIFILFYVFYIYVVSGSGFGSFINSLTSAQSVAWYVPFVWPALLLSYTVKGMYLDGFLFLVLTALFMAGLYYLAVDLNQRFGLYEPPAITLQKSGLYAPKTGILGKLGFSNPEAALIRKDLRAFTRRRELTGVFVPPIIFIIIPLLNSIGALGSGAPSSQSLLIFEAMLFLAPAAFMAMLVGEVLIGEEGQVMWRIYASPVSPKNLVKSKYFFTILLSTIFLLVSGTIGVVFYHPTLEEAIVGFLETFFVVLAVGGVSLAVGFKGPDFSQTRRARMIRQEWSLIGLITAGLTGAAVLAPLVPVVIAYLGGISLYSPLIGLAVSAVISVVLSVIFYRVNIGLADDLLKKGQI
jgi:hypothetical protein